MASTNATIETGINGGIRFLRRKTDHLLALLNNYVVHRKFFVDQYGRVVKAALMISVEECRSIPDDPE